MIEFISQSWPWFVSGPLIAMTMFLLLWIGANFGVSSTLRSICSIGGAGSHCDYFNFKWRDQVWNLVFVMGVVIGGFIASTFLQSPEPLALSQNTIKDLALLGIVYDGNMAPLTIFSWDNLQSVQGFIILIVGGFLIGFGTRWAGGCTSGHAISGLSNLQLPSLIAVIGFFIGGLLMTHLIFPFIF